MSIEQTSVQLLRRVHTDDEDALDMLLRRHRDWLWRYVQRHMSDGLRAFEASEDVVQDVLRKLLQRGPAFIPRDDDEFRLLVATIVLNRLRDRHDWIHAERRQRAREERSPTEGPTHIGFRADSADQPARVAARNEEQGLVNLALELIDPEDAHLIHLRNWEGLAFEEIGSRLELASDAARMRFNRALRRLGQMMRKLEQGELGELGAELPGI